NNYSLAFHNTLSGTQVRLVAAGSTAAHAMSQAYGMVYSTVQRQAAMLAFIDNFKMLGVIFLTVIPALALMKKPKVGSRIPVHCRASKRGFDGFVCTWGKTWQRK